MATLIMQKSSAGKRRRCDTKCYNALHDKCVCICGGMNHGIGLSEAVKFTESFARKFSNDQTVVLPNGKPAHRNHDEFELLGVSTLPLFLKIPT